MKAGTLAILKGGAVALVTGERVYKRDDRDVAIVDDKTGKPVETGQVEVFVFGQGTRSVDPAELTAVGGGKGGGAGGDDKRIGALESTVGELAIRVTGLEHGAAKAKPGDAD